MLWRSKNVDEFEQGSRWVSEILLRGELSGWTNQSTLWCWLIIICDCWITVRLDSHLYIYIHPKKQFHMKFHEFSWKFQWPLAAKRTFNLPEKIRSSPIKLSSPDHRMRVFGHQSEKCEAILCTLAAVWFACCIPIVYSSCFLFCFLLTLVYSSRLLQSLQTRKCCIILPASIASIYISCPVSIESRLLSKSTRCRFLQVLNPTSDSYEFNWMPEEVDKDVAPQPGAMPFRCLTK